VPEQRLISHYASFDKRCAKICKLRFAGLRSRRCLRPRDSPSSKFGLIPCKRLLSHWHPRVKLVGGRPGVTETDMSNLR